MDADKLNAINKAEQIVEVLALKGGPDGMFATVRDGFKALKEVNAQLEQENVNTMLALTEVYEQLLTLQGGTV